MSVRFLHYSGKPVHAVESASQDGVRFKPNGFWFSIEGENDWKSWCEIEKFQLQNLAFVHELTFKRNANILWLKGPSQIDLFHAQYTARPYDRDFAPNYIDWKRVAEKHQGIVIAPYCWARRLDGPAHDWYYSWDCASGCLWDASAIERIALDPLANAAAVA